ncbi:integral membrane protein [Aspergillus sclerotioniger CBS 115572]|uniref:Integral membrane protein n=1 Tax=Aspergillus sclerotioniger CBS 115572 TaxID=1450535 RepID=A0A317V4F3_9EURO|nr:integral membrane protein [Aspergillus sclerotioniger CBS 115572]PWY67958.1 integral membrane protein [Aspergillus sclerotioniger CBS 115572]
MTTTDGNASDDKGPMILAVLWALTGLTTVLVIARMYIRSSLLHNLGADDWLIAASLTMGLIYCGITTANVEMGYGKHAWLLSERTVEKATLLNCLSFLFGIISFTVPKLAVTAMLNRILNPNLIQRVYLWSLTSLTAVVSGICIIVLFTMCDPPKALWQSHLVTEGKATCKDVWILIDYAIFTGALSAFVDLTLAIYPSTVLMKLHMSLRKRLALCAALSLGAVASAMAIIKCTQLKGLADKTDYTYGTADLVMWTNIESNVVIIASCIPTLQPVLELILGRRTTSSYNNSRNKYKGSSQLPDSSLDHSKMSKPRKPDYEITTVGSQESILRDDTPRVVESHPMGAIRRTDNVTVEYESRSGEEAEPEPVPRTSW